MRIALPLLDGVDDLALAGVSRALAFAARDRALDATLETVAAEALVTTSSGVRLVPHRLGWGHLREADVIVLCGGPGVEAAAARDAPLVGALRAHLERPGAARLLAACDTGVLVLARAGLLDGRRVASPRAHRDALAGAAGDVPLGARVVQDGRLVTAAGPAAGVELGLHLVARLASPDAAVRASEALEVRGWAPP